VEADLAGVAVVGGIAMEADLGGVGAMRGIAVEAVLGAVAAADGVAAGFAGGKSRIPSSARSDGTAHQDRKAAAARANLL
jgi:hypothetical protein